MNILVVEDNPIDRKLFCYLFRTDGHGVVERGSAEAALEEMRKRCPDIILLDLNLPGLDGLALVRLMKADPDLRHIPVVAVTGAQEWFSQEDALAAGCNAFFPKPVDTRALPGGVARVLQTAPRAG
ncbi:MAG TPA: response regulator [Chthoniobacterales bacterium]